jgi:acyl-CoA reductase-like NAD-dependent aldehyde dehydrogenase
VAAGCTVVFKVSELCPQMHYLLAKIFHEAGFPDRVINVIQTRREDAPAVTEPPVTHPSIRKIEFIGSTPVNRATGQLAGQVPEARLDGTRRKRRGPRPEGRGPGGCHAEVRRQWSVMTASPSDWVESGSHLAAFLHHDQLCFSTKRVIVIESVAAKFRDLLKAIALTFETGSGVSEQIINSSLAELHA